MNIYLKRLFILSFFLLSFHYLKAQYTDGMTGLLHMVNAEVQKDATVMIGGNMLHKNNIPSKIWWGDYNTYNYYINITFLDRIEISYICTLYKKESVKVSPQYNIFFFMLWLFYWKDTRETKIVGELI